MLRNVPVFQSNIKTITILICLLLRNKRICRRRMLFKYTIECFLFWHLCRKYVNFDILNTLTHIPTWWWWFGYWCSLFIRLNTKWIWKKHIISFNNTYAHNLCIMVNGIKGKKYIHKQHEITFTFFRSSSIHVRYDGIF